MPVFCDLGTVENIEAMIRRRLGKHVLSDHAFAQQLLGGNFIAVLDGLSEYNLPPAHISDFIGSPAGEATCLLMSTRPDVTLRQAVEIKQRVVLVEPQRLKGDQLLAQFETTYLEQDKREPDSIAAPLSEDMKKACRSADDSYLPLLVRLAIRVGGGGKGSVAAVYEKTFELLLSHKGGDDKLLDEAARLCVRTYWQNGVRRIAFQGAAPETQRVLQRLRDAGIVVDDAVGLFRDRPRMVRFFHDSMQSYLTALGVFRGYAPDDTEKPVDGWRQLIRAAGDPVFKGQSDISSEVGAELFQMCLHVFIPPEELKRVFQSDLAAWAKKYERGLSKDDILHACPEDLRKALELQLDPQESAGIFLKKAVDLCTQDTGDREVRYLGILYGGLAPLIWELV
jgi:hypothetical protein